MSGAGTIKKTKKNYKMLENTIMVKDSGHKHLQFCGGMQTSRSFQQKLLEFCLVACFEAVCNSSNSDFPQMIKKLTVADRHKLAKKDDKTERDR